ncbi:MAG: Eco57I restriction-modification methylase domain-containing protein [Candidatus Lokiarchaeota archaeon]|nr:Eco57I restriction-modification methylase domain-containing protein [Candidatus Lokiarchaeota archaeon]
MIDLNYYNRNKRLGQFFTPEYIAAFMVKNSYDYIIKYIHKPIDEISILEPSAGKGIFLQYLIDFGFKNITAYEIDPKLILLLKKKYPIVDFRFENILTASINKKYDLIIGNPPYLGQNYHSKLFQDYIKKSPFCQKYFVGNMDLFYYFIHIGIEKLYPKGILSFITTNYWITKHKNTGIKFLKPHLVKNCYFLQYIDLSNMILFNEAKGQHNCIFTIQKKDSKNYYQKGPKIEVIRIRKSKNQKIKEAKEIKSIFNYLIDGKEYCLIDKYNSALNQKELMINLNWNILYPEVVRNIIDKFEELCKKDNKITTLKDYFIIRNGIIFIKDDIFILEKSKNLIIKNSDFYIKINEKYYKLTENEKKRLKKIFKSKAIREYNYCKDDYIGYGIFINKNEFLFKTKKERNQNIKECYPHLSKYILNHSDELKKILINAKENQDDFYFPRRGVFIRNFSTNSLNKIDLEKSYEKRKKIFFKFISEKNVFGYSETQYYATSDTYFLWPKINEEYIDYPLFIAYLNSKFVYFLFKAKGISIKRSKSKLEENLPIPNFSLLNSNNDKLILSFIRILAQYLSKSTKFNFKEKSSTLLEKIKTLINKSNSPHFNFLKQIQDAIKCNDNIKIKDIIDEMFFLLFKIEKETIMELLYKYYN